MQLLTKSELSELSVIGQPPCVSIYLSTHTQGSSDQQASFKTLIREAESQLHMWGIAAPDASRYLAFAHTLVDDPDLWHYEKPGMAFFLSPSISRYYCLPLEFESEVMVSDRFHLQSLLPIFLDNAYFYILVLTQQGGRLYQATYYQMAEVSLEVEDKSMESVPIEISFPSPLSQGQPLKTSLVTDGKMQATLPAETFTLEVTHYQYCQVIAEKLSTSLKRESAPLILVAPSSLQKIYRAVNTYPYLLDQPLTADFGNQPPHDLLTQTLALAKPVLEREKKARIEQIRNFHLAGQSLEQVTRLVPTAYAGQVETLLVADDAHSWGQFNAITGTVEMHTEAALDDLDLLDLTAIYTYLKGGSVYQVPSESMPQGLPAIAICRYDL